MKTNKKSIGRGFEIGDCVHLDPLQYPYRTKFISFKAIVLDIKEPNRHHECDIEIQILTGDKKGQKTFIPESMLQVLYKGKSIQEKTTITMATKKMIKIESLSSHLDYPHLNVSFLKECLVLKNPKYIASKQNVNSFSISGETNNNSNNLLKNGKKENKK